MIIAAPRVPRNSALSRIRPQWFFSSIRHGKHQNAPHPIEHVTRILIRRFASRQITHFASKTARQPFVKAAQPWRTYGRAGTGPCQSRAAGQRFSVRGSARLLLSHPPSLVIQEK